MKNRLREVRVGSYYRRTKTGKSTTVRAYEREPTAATTAKKNEREFDRFALGVMRRNNYYGNKWYTPAEGLLVRAHRNEENKRSVQKVKRDIRLRQGGLSMSEELKALLRRKKRRESELSDTK